MGKSDSSRDIVPAFAARLREFREARGWTIAELSRRAQVHRGTIHHLEAGTRAPSFKMVLSLAAALGVTCEELSR